MQTIDLNVLGLRDGQRALDLGCGAGRHVHAMYYHAQCHVVGLDLGYEDVRKTRDGFGSCPDMDPETQRAFSLTVGNALSLPFPDASFDKVLCSEVLEHIPDYKQAVAEIDRILKPGGTLAVSVPRFWPEWVCWALSDDYHNEPGGHVRIFRESELKGAVEARGLSFFHRHFAHGLHSPYWWLKCAVGVKREDVKLVNLYKRFLEWDILQRPWLTRTLEKIAGPLMGKSVVLYFTKGAA
ncbi:class I SAM-dependent methyltransferase [Parvibaculum sp.]|mgnify:FL=1|jgi:SAM-dependent methyltransferase|uniref:class I SAM-dependent methyltransferase n=1 Tax=Parvibaculum sp. TaxID=2024848 RepID=UPI000C497761|nr:class I SAM-dependent methyltransferase [Parvibaculum sp.]MAU59959.1 SAM-dependent methyltransferase [Parvibaculum sp.]MBO6668900.1 class I SAM-dependent methyltransferase [Parvibaculum sp.]MBO6691791.1 class I SAM-dependent methyltransferase [Parvibaculum sp.]MBO6715550.1 class I SAM-dependent methyltransferase [Parvibaculum sp.]|tara:strand:- start:2120 stop:2836 length:717 start_codon:yes stop_codon:yes gene_type:complete